MVRTSNEIKVFPNPTAGKVFILSKDLQSVEMMDLSGRKIHIEQTQLSDDLLEINCACESGIYHLLLSNETGIKFVKIEIVK